MRIARTASASAKKTAATRRVKPLGKKGSVSVSRIRAAVKKVSAAR